MKIITESELFTQENIAIIEERYKALFVCDTCLKARGGGWINEAVAVFWNRDPANIPVGGSAYFGMFHRYEPPNFKKSQLMITNAISAIENVITGIVAENGDIIFSRFRHDYRGSPDGSVWIDGGRDYTRYGFHRALTAGGELVGLQIKNGMLGIVPLKETREEVRSPIPTPELQNSGGWESK